MKSIIAAVTVMLLLHDTDQQIHRNVITSNLLIAKEYTAQRPVIDTLPITTKKQDWIFEVKKILDSNLHYFKKGDIIDVSPAKGLLQYRKGKMIQNYKIIPQQIEYSYQINCKLPPCPRMKKTETVYYLGAAKRFIRYSGGMLYKSSRDFDDTDTSIGLEKEEWLPAYEIKSLQKLP